MGLIWGSLWRAWRDSFRARVLALCLLPFVLTVVGVGALVIFFWEPALDEVRVRMDQLGLLDRARQWLTTLGLEGILSFLAPMALVFLSTPVIAIGSMLIVMAVMSGFLASLVAKRRFPLLAREQGGSMFKGWLRALGLSLIALVALIGSLPFWLIPPLAVLLPAVIWAWLNYQVIWYDALADHASVLERRQLARQHRVGLWGMALVVGMLGSLPCLLWAIMPAALPMAPLLVPVILWIYIWVYAFAVLWFAHFGLGALERLRARDGAAPVVTGQEGTSEPPALPGGGGSAEAPRARETP
jgi:hypothetical protein